ncbi:histidine phosphatase family protein [Xenorhabdus sp. SGI246]|uniref:histidine phosphatase family protein n=1 Tax=Xenorhabdus sp. SGI246 TaxID=3158263 RepID=UPI00349F9948
MCNPTIVIPEGESAIEVAQRDISYMQSLVMNSRDKIVCLITHDRIQQSLIWQLKEDNLREDTTQYHRQNCSYSVFDITKKHISVVYWGVATHSARI